MPRPKKVKPAVLSFIIHYWHSLFLFECSNTLLLKLWRFKLQTGFSFWEFGAITEYLSFSIMLQVSAELHHAGLQVQALVNPPHIPPTPLICFNSLQKYFCLLSVLFHWTVPHDSINLINLHVDCDVHLKMMWCSNLSSFFLPLCLLLFACPLRTCRRY